MKRTVQVYVADVDGVLQRLDLFKDETISLKDTIQDVRDIAKVFTEFTQSFTVPASKTNNKLFKHFYNADISNGYDARLLHNARIEINSIPFKEGFITLEGVDMKNNKPNGYRIIFYGNTVSLKDIIGDDKLSSLTSLSSLNQKYISKNDGTNDGIKEFLTKDSSNASNDLIVPLITHTQRLYYDSTENNANVGNIYYKNTGQKHGVRWDNLKYAIRVQRIIEAIEAKYTQIDFTSDFFTDSNDSFFNLFMWLHRKKGYVEDPSLPDQVTVPLANWTVNSQTHSSITNTSTLKLDAVDSTFVFTRLDLVFDDASGPFDIQITRDGVVAHSSTISSGDTTLNLNSIISGGSEYQVSISISSAVSFTDYEWVVEYEGESAPSGGVDRHTSTSNPTIAAVQTFSIPEQIPDMTIIDFLTGLFKMFNLTAFVQDDGKIYVDTLDEFYVDKQSSGNPYNIDEFVSSESSASDSALPFRKVNFKYEDTETLLAKQHEQLSGQAWAEENFDRLSFSSVGLGEVNTNLSGEIYTVEVPFGHMKFERLIDLNDGSTNTVIQWGYSADDNFDRTTGDYDSYIGEPLLFYPVYHNVSANPISLVTEINASDSFTAHEEINGSINIPSNSIAITGTNKKNINFKPEKNEYEGNEFLNTLFKQYYETYIKQMFTKSNRIIKIKAYLPLRILLNYTLADKFIYKGRKHQINSITTNLTTGESEIELLNIVIE